MKQIRIIMIALLGLMVLSSSKCNPDPEPFNSGGGGGGTSYPQTYSQTVTVSAQGGTQTVKLSDLKSAVSSVSTTPTWLVISPQFYSSGAPTIKLEVEPNANTTERECTVSVLATSGDKVQLTVKQKSGSEPDPSIEDPHNEQTDQPAFAPRR